MTSWNLLSVERPLRAPGPASGAPSGAGESSAPAHLPHQVASCGRVIAFGLLLFFLHVFCMLYRYGHRPPAPVIGDEVTINDPAIALSRGQGLVAPSFKDSVFGFDKLYAHFPPVYAYVESLAFRTMGVSSYSLRLTTTLTDILAAAVFMLFLYWLWRRGLVDIGTAAFAAMFYTLNASVIALHRIARMEPLVELSSLIALWCALAAIESMWSRGAHHSVAFSVAACMASGIAFVTHPEALTAVLPVLLLVGMRRGVTWPGRLLYLCIFVATPAAVWVAAYGSRSIEALQEMWRVVRFTPGPGVFSFAHQFTREDHRNIGQGMRGSLFVLCLALLVAVVVQWWRLESRGRAGLASETDEIRLSVTRAFALATAISLVLLIWFVGASISRYEVMYPVWLLGLALALRGISWSRPTRIIAGLAAAIIGAEIVAAAGYLWRPEASPVDLDPHRFDAILAQIPRGDSVAATPMLWLAFEQQNRPFTLLYWRYDGREKWKQENGGDPLKQFDAVVVDESFIDDYRDDVPYASQGRREYRYVVGSDVVHLFLPR